MKKKHLVRLLRILVSVLLVTVFILRSDLPSVLSSFSTLSPASILGALAVFTISIALYTLRWFLLLRRYPFIRLLKLNLISFYYAILLTGQLAGEAVKAYRLARKSEEAEKIVASVLVDRVTGLVGLIVVGMIGLLLTHRSLPAGFVASFVVAFGVCVMVVWLIRIPFVFNAAVQGNEVVKKRLVKMQKPMDRMRLFL